MSPHYRASLPSRAPWRRSRGSLSVEMAIVAPILVMLMFGIIEMGLLFKDAVALHSACREAVRVASIGGGTAAVVDRSRAAAPGLNTAAMTVQVSYRTYDNGVWSSWIALPTGGATPNNVPTGAQIRVSLSYPHSLIAGGFFPGLASEPGGNSVTLRSNMVMMRE